MGRKIGMWKLIWFANENKFGDSFHPRKSRNFRDKNQTKEVHGKLKTVKSFICIRKKNYDKKRNKVHYRRRDN